MNALTKQIKPGKPVATIEELASPLDAARDFVQDGMRRGELEPLLAFYQRHNPPPYGYRESLESELQTEQGKKALAVAKHMPALLKAVNQHQSILTDAITIAASAPELRVLVTVMFDKYTVGRELNEGDAIKVDATVSVVINNREDARDDDADPDDYDYKPSWTYAAREPISRAIAAAAVLDVWSTYKSNFPPTAALYLAACKLARKRVIACRREIADYVKPHIAAHKFVAELAKPKKPALTIAACRQPAPTKRS